mmetsp:Transcript_20274/g.64505  ORF Transcript_20274/g.64505 Transcript_20274/m.64505 type:complete len:302 (+) Transcript_20274:1243-2148(+)
MSSPSEVAKRPSSPPPVPPPRPTIWLSCTVPTSVASSKKMPEPRAPTTTLRRTCPYESWNTKPKRGRRWVSAMTLGRMEHPSTRKGFPVWCAWRGYLASGLAPTLTTAVPIMLSSESSRLAVVVRPMSTTWMYLAVRSPRPITIACARTPAEATRSVRIVVVRVTMPIHWSMCECASGAASVTVDPLTEATVTYSASPGMEYPPAPTAMFLKFQWPMSRPITVSARMRTSPASQHSPAPGAVRVVDPWDMPEAKVRWRQRARPSSFTSPPRETRPKSSPRGSSEEGTGVEKVMVARAAGCA